MTRKTYQALFCFLVGVVGIVRPTLAAPAFPDCGGTDLVAQAKQADPAAYQAILEKTSAIPNGEGLLWTIRRGDGPTSYLFGTIHSSDSRVVAIAESMAKYLAHVQTVATELGDFESPATKAVMAVKIGFKLAANTVHTETFITAPEDRERIGAVLKSIDMPPDVGLKMPPWLLVAAFALPPCELLRQRQDLPTVDGTVVTIGKQAGATIVALETIDEQLDALQALDPALSVREMMVLARRTSLIGDMFATMVALYRQQRIGTLLPASETLIDSSPQDRAADRAFNEQIVEKRNAVMATRAEPLIDAGPVFIAVGALHLIGEKGLVARLRLDGYAVERVP